MVEFKVVLSTAGFILILLLLGIIFKILPIIGFFVLIFGVIVFLVGMNNNSQEDVVWGAILFFGGIAIMAIGITAYNTLEEYGIIDFIKIIFKSS